MKPRGKPFAKGNTAAQNKRKLTPTQADAKAAVLEAIARIALMPQGEIAKLSKDPKTIGAELIAINLIASSKNVGEALDRTIGPVPKILGPTLGEDGKPIAFTFNFAS